MVGLRHYILAENERGNRPVLNTNWQGLAQDNVPKVALAENASGDQQPNIPKSVPL